MQHTVLVCDDDSDIRAALAIYLQQDGYKVISAASGNEALAQLQQEEVHLILLDIMMPVLDGLQVATKIREFSNIPIVFLTAKAEDTDRILGLHIGGDDYITKPFNPVELLARVRAVLRRYTRLGGLRDAGVNADAADIYRTGGLELNDSLKRVTLEGVSINLTATEYSILKLLLMSPDRVYSSAQIYEAVWNEPAFNVSKTVSAHIRRIREKIEINPAEPNYLKVVYGLGYKVVGM